jgi:general secretion pathway protein I
MRIPFSGRCSRRFPPHPQAGFTLMEVMVALSVVAIALLAVYRMHGQTLFMNERGRFDTMATMLANEKLADMDGGDLADLSSDSGDFGSDYPGYAWKIESETVSSDLFKDDGPTLKRINLSISYNDDEAAFTLTTYRLLYE